MPVFNNVLAGAAGSGGAAAAAQIDRSLRFNPSDSAYLSRTPSSTGNTATWTWTCWVKKAKNGSELFLLRSDVSGGNARDAIRFESTDTLRVFFNGMTGGDLITDQVFRDPSAWYHIVVAVDTTQATASDRVKIYVNGSQVTSFSSATYPSQDYSTGTFVSGKDATIARDSSGNYLDGYLADVHFIDGQALAPTAFGEYDDNNVWQPIEYAGTYGTNGFYLDFSDNSSNAALGTDAAGSNDWTVNNLTATARNYTSEGSTSGSFYDSAGGAASKMFDGSASTGAFSQSGTATFTFGGSTITASTSLKVRAFKGDASGANVLVNGTDISSLLNTQSGGGYSTVNITSTLGGAPINLSNVSVVNAGGGSGNIAQIFVDDVELIDADDSDIDSLIDTPTNYEADSGNNGGNYATMNPLDKDANCTLSNGNLDVSCSTSGWFGANATMEVLAGKTYFEATYVSGSYVNIGLNTPNTGVGDVNTDGVHLQNDNGTWRVRNGSSATSISAVSANSIIGVAVDTSANTIQFFVNGTSVYSGTLNALHRIPLVYGYGTYSVSVNFGQRPFAYTPPTDHLSLCTQNLADPTIADGSTAFEAKTYTGTGSSNSITGLNFSPDFVWIKSRSDAYWHYLYDAVRGATKELYSNATNAEDTDAGGLTSFDSNGFSLGSNIATNGSAKTFVGWTWDAGTTTDTNNIAGSITPTGVRANPSAGFSIVSVSTDGTDTIRTAGHGLNATPEFIISKNRDFDDNWFVYHKDIQTDNKQRLNLNTTGAVDSSGSLIWAHTSSVIGFNGAQYVGLGTDDLIFYCWAPVEGFSAFGSYTGTGTSDNSAPFVYTGMRPRWIMIKSTSATGNWAIYDTERDTDNAATQELYSDTTGAENNSGPTDILSNGFKLRNTHGHLNSSGVTYAWAAFAEHPFKTARAR